MGKITSTEASKPLRLFIYTHPRTASNLFVKMISKQTGVKQHLYPFMDAFNWSPDRQALRHTRGIEVLREKLGPGHKESTYQNRMDRMEVAIGEAEAAGLGILIKEHVQFFMDPQVIADNYPIPRTPPARPIIIDHKLDMPTDHRDSSLSSDDPLPTPNPTLIPNRLFKTFAPVLIIRHPGRMVPSWWRVSAPSWDLSPDDVDLPMNCSYKWLRLLFDCYDAYFHSQDFIDTKSPILNGAHNSNGYANGNSGRNGSCQWPIVIDGDDLVNNAEEIMGRLCALTGLNASEVLYEWDPNGSANYENKGASEIARRFQGTLLSSSGVTKEPKLKKPPVIKEERKIWAADWGEEVASRLEELAEAAMEDYEYLWQYRL